MLSIKDIVREVKVYENDIYIEWESGDSDVLIREYKSDGAIYLGYRASKIVVAIYREFIIGIIC